MRRLVIFRMYNVSNLVLICDWNCDPYLQIWMCPNSGTEQCISETPGWKGLSVSISYDKSISWQCCISYIMFKLLHFFFPGLLTILLYHINVSLGSSWGQDKGHSGFDGQLGRDGRLNSLHVLRGNTTGLYLCMDDHSVPYQSVSRFSRKVYIYINCTAFQRMRKIWKLALYRMRWAQLTVRSRVVCLQDQFAWSVHRTNLHKKHSQLAFYVNLHRAVIGPSATLTGRWRPDIDLRRMLTGFNIEDYLCLFLTLSIAFEPHISGDQFHFYRVN